MEQRKYTSWGKISLLHDENGTFFASFRDLCDFYSVPDHVMQKIQKELSGHIIKHGEEILLDESAFAMVVMLIREYKIKFLGIEVIELIEKINKRP